MIPCLFLYLSHAGGIMKYVRKVLRYRKSTTFVSVGKIIPKDWNYVSIEVIEKGENYIILKICKVM